MIIPDDFRKKQKEIEKLEWELASKVIDADFSFAPYILESDGFYMFLRIRNNEPKNLTGCEAKLTKLIISCDEKGGLLDYSSFIIALGYPNFIWQENQGKEIAIEKEAETILCIGKVKDNRILSLSLLEDEYNFPGIQDKNGNYVYEIRYKLELSGFTVPKHQMFCKSFFGRLIFTAVPILQWADIIYEVDLNFDEISESDLVQNL